MPFAVGARLTWVAAVVVTSAALAQSPAKRPITHADYSSWRTINNQKLSPDGRFLAYALFPQEGDGEVVLKNLQTGAERRFPAGARPSGSERPADPEATAEPSPSGPPVRGISLEFGDDSRNLVFTTFPAKADTDKARKAKKKPEEMPKGEMVIVSLDGGEPVRIASVRSFDLARDSGEWLAYLKEGEPGTEAAAPEKKSEDEDQRRGSAPTATRVGSTRQYGSEMVLRSLKTGVERKFADVLICNLSDDGEMLTYTVGSKKDESNGVFVLMTKGGEPKALLSGKGKYQGLTWDEKQQRLAFYSDHDAASERQPTFKIYFWDRGAEKADVAVAADKTGFRSGWTVAERGSLSFSKDGKRLFFNAAPKRAARLTAPADGDEGKAVADLWHWKDDNVQPMQKVRAEQERSRSYRAAYDMAADKVIQLADPTMTEVIIDKDSLTGIGSDDREYRAMVEYGERASDVYSVDVETGKRTLLFRKKGGYFTPSPDGRYISHFDGRDWLSVELSTRKVTNLTANLGVAFFNEDQDTPNTRVPYGSPGWTKDGASILVYDRFDVWQLQADGSRARMITDGIGRRQKMEFRYIRVIGEDDRPGAGRPTIDPAKPLLLSAESIETRETGFWEDRLDQDVQPRKLVMAAKRFTIPVKAKRANVMLLSASRFDEFGDLLVGDVTFANLKKVSNANPQKEQVLWGSAELISYTNSDGVRLKATLHKPENFDPNKKYPMLVYIYERLSQSVHFFRAPSPGTSINIPYYTSNGYLVLTPDIVYTAGYPGQSALKCVLPAIQAVADKGFVNENAIGIQGHSWGGYQIAYMITQTTRFKAAAAGAPVANMISAYDGIRWGSGLPRQFQYERTQSRIGGTIWQYPMRFLENSPIFWADRVKTPLLMVHNDGDDAVPWYQGIEYFLALRRLGQETYLFNYNGEPHGIRKRANQKDYTLRMQQFFDHHLKGAPKPEWMDRGIPYIERDQEKERWKKTFESAPSGDRP